MDVYIVYLDVCTLCPKAATNEFTQCAQCIELSEWAAQSCTEQSKSKNAKYKDDDDDDDDGMQFWMCRVRQHNDQMYCI